MIVRDRAPQSVRTFVPICAAAYMIGQDE